MGTEKSITVIDITGEVDVATLDDVRDSIMQALANGSHILVNCSECGFVDSATLGLFLDAHTKSIDNGASFQIIAPLNSPVASIIAMAHLDSVLTIADSLQDANDTIQAGGL